MSERERRDRSPTMGDFRRSFEAIAEFARRQKGGGGGGGGFGGSGGDQRREDSRERDGNSQEMNVPNNVMGAVIGGRGAKIREQ